MKHNSLVGDIWELGRRGERSPEKLGSKKLKNYLMHLDQWQKTGQKDKKLENVLQGQNGLKKIIQ